MRFAHCIGAFVVAAIISTSAIAQPPGGDGERRGPGRGGPQLSQEAQAKAWDTQAAVVAKQLSLDEEKSKKLAEAYKAARTSYTAAMRERFSSGERNPSALGEVTLSERGKFETALKGFLSEDETKKAISTLGTFNRRWDGMVAVVDELGLEEKAKADAMAAITTYIADSSKVMEEAFAGGGGSPESVREKVAPLREKLDADMGKVLNAEQLAKWKEATAMRGGGRRGGGEGQGGDRPSGGQPPAVSGLGSEKKAE